MQNLFNQFYGISPVWLQNFGISTYGLLWRHRRFGGRFRSLIEEFTARENYSSSEWEQYQTLQLRSLLKYAIQFVPHYRKSLFQTIQNQEDLSRFSLKELPNLPLLEKDTIRKNPESMISTNVKRNKLHAYHTSGTTGTPIAIMFTNDMHRRWSAAYEVRVRRWAGLHYKMSRAMIGGRLVVPKAKAEPPFWRYNLAERQLYMSAFHISPQNAQHYVQALNHYQPDYLVGYASSHYFLARMINEQGLDVIQPKAVLTSSENLTDEMRNTLETVYRCPVFDAYSGVEANCLASECEYHRLHVSPDVGIVELIDENGHPVKAGEPGEIVATGLLNFEQPLIRYRTGDLAVWSDETCLCGREMPIIHELVGRLEDTVIGLDGREMFRFHGIFVGLPHVREGQVIQETLSHIRLKLVVDEDFNDLDRQVIAKRFEERLGGVDLTFDFVDKIERTERGKFRAVISNVKRDPSTIRIENSAD